MRCVILIRCVLTLGLTYIKFTHTFPYLTEDVPKDKSYGWDNITKASTEDSVKNADNLGELITTHRTKGLC